VTTIHIASSTTHAKCNEVTNTIVFLTDAVYTVGDKNDFSGKINSFMIVNAFKQLSDRRDCELFVTDVPHVGWYVPLIRASLLVEVRKIHGSADHRQTISTSELGDSDQLQCPKAIQNAPRLKTIGMHK